MKAPQKLWGPFYLILCSVPSAGLGTGYFLLGAMLCTLASGFFCSSLCSVPSAGSGTGYFLLGAALCTLASGYFLLISALCTLHRLGHWVFPAGCCALCPRLWVFLLISVLCTLRLLEHWVFPAGCCALCPRLWVFSAHLCALYPPSARALGISCWVPRFVPSPLGVFCSSLCSMPSAGSGTGYFLLNAVLCTLASGYLKSRLASHTPPLRAQAACYSWAITKIL